MVANSKVDCLLIHFAIPVHELVCMKSTRFHLSYHHARRCAKNSFEEIKVIK